MKKIYSFLFLISISFFSSCEQNKVNTINNTDTTMTQKITEQDLENQPIVKVKTDKGYLDCYSVIIYTDNSSELLKNGILVQTISKNFVTALIKKEDLKILNKINSIKSIQLPQNDFPTIK